MGKASYRIVYLMREQFDGTYYYRASSQDDAVRLQRDLNKYAKAEEVRPSDFYVSISVTPERGWKKVKTKHDLFYLIHELG